MALIDHCVENLPECSEDPLRVPLPELSHRVLALYWPQVRPFEGRELRQRRTGSIARIPDAARSLREAVGGNCGLSLAVAMLRAPAVYRRAIAKMNLALAKQPLPRLQKLPGSPVSDPFLYDDSFLGENVSMRQLESHGNAITLSPGVAFALARLAGLLKPALEILWVEDIRHMNKFLDADVPDVAGHLFGRERIPLTPVREAFRKAFGPQCFYCQAHLSADTPVDHVLPWSIVGLDGLANLVLACARCTGNKGSALPAVAIVDRVLKCDHVVLEEIAREIEWSVTSARRVRRRRPAPAASCGRVLLWGRTRVSGWGTEHMPFGWLLAPPGPATQAAPPNWRPRSGSPSRC
jgi:hypothetical protein